MEPKLIEKDPDNYPDYDDSVTLESGVVRENSEAATKDIAVEKLPTSFPFLFNGKAPS